MVKIIVLIVLIVLLSGGIFFALKSEMFSSKENDVVEKDGQNNEDAKKEEEEENSSAESEEKEETEPEEAPKEETPKEETKPVTPKKETPSVNKTEINVVKPVTNNNNNSNNNNNNSGSGKEETPVGDSNNQGDSQGSNTQTPEPVKPSIPNGGLLTCKLVQPDEEGTFTHIVAGVFDSSDGYLRTYKETYIFDYSSSSETLTDEERLELEEEIKEMIIEINQDIKSALSFSSSSQGNIFNVYIDSDYDRFKAIAPGAFTSTGHFYYNNFTSVYVSNGYTCS